MSHIARAAASSHTCSLRKCVFCGSVIAVTLMLLVALWHVGSDMVVPLRLHDSSFSDSLSTPPLCGNTSLAQLLDVSLPAVAQFGVDGFGHQLEGMMGVVALHVVGRVRYQFRWKRRFAFEHMSPAEAAEAVRYLRRALEILGQQCMPTSVSERQQFAQEEERFLAINQTNHTHEVAKLPAIPDPDVLYTLDNAFREPTSGLLRARALLRKAFVTNNEFLPKPTFTVPRNFPQRRNSRDDVRNIVVHVRLGDASYRQADEFRQLLSMVPALRKRYPWARITVHSNGELPSFAPGDNIFVYDTAVKRRLPVLQVMSDFVRADVLVASASSLSFAATWLVPDCTTIYASSHNADSMRTRTRPSSLCGKTYFNYVV